MNDTIYSAKFAKQLCDEYNSLQNRINRAIKEAVSQGQYYSTIVICNHDTDDEDILDEVKRFSGLGYRLDLLNYNFFVPHSVKINIFWD